MAGIFDRLKADCIENWRAYAEHSFVRQMGQGTLPRPAFQRYLVQDYLFLIQFSRAYALAIYKSRSLSQMHQGLEGLKAILEVEMQLHVKLCADWGINKIELENTQEAAETVAYTRLVLDAGMSGDLLDLYAALAPCMIGYAEIGTALQNQAGPDNPYSVWIAEYASDGYQQVAEAAKLNLDQLAEEYCTEARYPKLLRLFRAATDLERDFWQMGLNAAV